MGDLRLLTTSFVAVATSPPMFDWPRYRALVESERTPVANPYGCDAVTLHRACSGRSLAVACDLARLVAVLVSHTDDHSEPLPHEILPREASLLFIRRVAQELGSHTLSTAHQLSIAVELTGDPWLAILVCHLAIRQLARGRDVRALGRDAPVDIRVRCQLGRAIAPFPDSLAQGGDPLGDTYHYWANVAAGVAAASAGGTSGAATRALFRCGPLLMLWVRERTFRSRLFYGTHDHIDRLGLRHGEELARLAGIDRGSTDPRRGHGRDQASQNARVRSRRGNGRRGDLRAPLIRGTHNRANE